ncbi:MAG TPA: pyridoxal-phosphate dependent enzyme, partial [Longimicrobium sp.]
MTTLSDAAPSMADVLSAARRLQGIARRTPLERSDGLSGEAGVFLKLEGMQRTGSFKLRGAYNRMVHLSPDERHRGVIAASAGNHAQGVAYAGQRLGIRSVIVMP